MLWVLSSMIWFWSLKGVVVGWHHSHLAFHSLGHLDLKLISGWLKKKKKKLMDRRWGLSLSWSSCIQSLGSHRLHLSHEIGGWCLRRYTSLFTKRSLSQFRWLWPYPRNNIFHDHVDPHEAFWDTSDDIQESNDGIYIYYIDPVLNHSEIIEQP